VTVTKRPLLHAPPLRPQMPRASPWPQLHASRGVVGARMSDLQLHSALFMICLQHSHPDTQNSALLDFDNDKRLGQQHALTATPASPLCARLPHVLGAGGGTSPWRPERSARRPKKRGCVRGSLRFWHEATRNFYALRTLLRACTACTCCEISRALGGPFLVSGARHALVGCLIVAKWVEKRDHESREEIRYLQSWHHTKRK